MAYANKEDAKRYNHEWYLKRRKTKKYKDHKRKYDKKYHSHYKNPNIGTLEYKLRCRAYSKKYKDRNRELVRKRDRLYKRKTYHRNYIVHRNYVKNHIDKIKYYQEKYKNNGATKRSQLKSRYGITQEIFQMILKNQNYLCPICGDDFKNRKPYIDHCHKTGKIRGLVHMQCNVLIGFAKDDPDILNKAANYLRSHT